MMPPEEMDSLSLVALTDRSAMDRHEQYIDAVLASQRSVPPKDLDPSAQLDLLKQRDFLGLGYPR